MGKRSGSAIGVLLITIAFLVFPLLLNAFDEIGRAEATNTATIVTGLGETSGNITLHNSLYSDALTSVDNITSTVTADVPLAAAYSTATKQLNVSGLGANDTRSLTVTYDTARDDYSLSTLSSFTPMVLFMCLLLSGLAMLWRSWN